MRHKIYRIIDVQDDHNTASKLYNSLNIIIIALSLLPLMFHTINPTLRLINNITVVFFVIEYILHLITADYNYPNRSKLSAFLTYPVSLMGIIDLLSILPSIINVTSAFRLLRLVRLLRSLRVFRAFKLFRYSKSFKVLFNTIRKQRNVLTFIASLTFMYILLAALIIFNVESQQFPNFLEALYWATMTLTTSTYGNYHPTSVAGNIITQISFLVAVIVIALPSSVITAGYIDELDTDPADGEEYDSAQDETDYDTLIHDIQNDIDARLSIEDKVDYDHFIQRLEQSLKDKYQ